VTRLRHTIEHLQRNGDQVLIVAPDGGISVTRSQSLRRLWLPCRCIRVETALPRPAIGQALEEFQPDIIHVVNPAVLGLAGLFYSKVLNIPLVASYHTHLPQYLQHYGLGMLEGLLWELLKASHNQAELICVHRQR